MDFKIFGDYPAAEYLADKWTQDTIDFDLWRVRSAKPESCLSTLAESACRLGQLSAEGVAEKDTAIDLLHGSVTANSAFESGWREVINSNFDVGAKDPGFDLYRLVIES